VMKACAAEESAKNTREARPAKSFILIVDIPYGNDIALCK